MRFRWVIRRRTERNLRSIWIFVVGQEWGPHLPWGESRLTVQPDGRFSFENRSGGHVRWKKTGWIELSAVEQMAMELAEAGFPSVPKHSIVPEGGVGIIAKGRNEKRVFMCDREARRFRGYGPLLERIRAWERFLRGDAKAEVPAALHLDP